MRVSIAPVAGLAALASLFAFAPASAKTEAECKQEYAAKKAADKAELNSREAYLKGRNASYSLAHTITAFVPSQLAPIVPSICGVLLPPAQ
jgi:hypothetical protein